MSQRPDSARVKLAFLFPGQGAQAVGMGSALAEARPEAANTSTSSPNA